MHLRSLSDHAPADRHRLAGTPTVGAVDPSTQTVYVTVCAGTRTSGAEPWHQRRVGVRREHLQRDRAIRDATSSARCQYDTPSTALQGVQVDPANQTLYTANGDNTISAFDLRSCSAADLAGCATDTPGIVTLPAPGFEVTLWVAVDTANHSVYVTNQKDDSLIVVNANVCNGSDLAGCATLSRPAVEIHTGGRPAGPHPRPAHRDALAPPTRSTTTSR